MTPLISFILPSHNRKPVLREVLSRLVPAEQPFHSEVIVIDNASDDGSVDMVQAEFPWVRLIALNKNLGAISRNLGLDAAAGEYIVMLDDDSYPLPGAVAGGVRALGEDHQRTIGCIAFNIQRPDGSFETAGIYTAFTGCGAMFRRSLFDEIGGYPDDYLFYVEEYDLSCRIWASGARVVNPKSLQVMHLKTDVSRSFDRIMRQLVRNNMLLWSKYLPPDMAARQIDAELWRYQRIASKEGAENGYAEGCQQGQELVARFAGERSHELAVGVAERMVTADAIRHRVATLAAHTSGRRLLVWNIGKQLYLILDELRRQGWQVLGIVDDNRFMQGDHYQEVEIFSRQRLTQDDHDLVLIGSSSLAINDSLEAMAASCCGEVPVVRMCDYDVLPGEAS